MELLFNRSIKYIPNPLLSVGTYILGSLLFFFSPLLFMSVVDTYSVHDMTRIPIAWDSLTEKLCSQRTRDNQPPCDVSAAHLFLFETRKPKRPFALKKAENEQLGFGQSGYIHIAHAGICPSICSPDTKWSKFCQLIQNQRTNEAIPRQNVVTRHFYEI